MRIYLLSAVSVYAQTGRTERQTQPGETSTKDKSMVKSTDRTPHCVSVDLRDPESIQRKDEEGDYRG